MKSINLTKKLQAAQLKVTNNRLAVLDFLCRNTKPISSDVIIQATKIDKVTVYRIMNIFLKQKIIREFDLRQGKIFYELSDRPSHHHIICTNCGVVQDVNECFFDKIKTKVLSQSGFDQVTDHSMEFFGICKKCV